MHPNIYIYVDIFESENQLDVISPDMLLLPSESNVQMKPGRSEDINSERRRLWLEGKISGFVLFCFVKSKKKRLGEDKVKQCYC